MVGLIDVAVGSVIRTVAVADCADTVGSGDVPALATPRLLVWAEMAALNALAGALNPTDTSVGVEVTLRHLVSSGVGSTITVTATLASVSGPRVRFDVTAVDESRRTVARGVLTRQVVDLAAFVSRLGPRCNEPATAGDAR